jgi:tetratricopeptide (TPR) repeat protein
MMRYLLIAALIAIVPATAARAQSLARARALLGRKKFVESASTLEKLARAQPRNDTVLAWLGLCYTYLQRYDEARAMAAEAIAIAPCNALANTVYARVDLGTANNEAWEYFNAAITCDSTAGDAWIYLHELAIERDDSVMARTALLQLYRTRFFTRAVMNESRLMLRNLPPNAILITNSDIEEYPALVVQAAEGFRTDVAIVAQPYLQLPANARWVRDHHHLPLPYSNAELDAFKPSTMFDGSRTISFTLDRTIIADWIARDRRGELGRPIAFGLITENSTMLAYDDVISHNGLFALVMHDTVMFYLDTAATRRCLSDIDPHDFSGPVASALDFSPYRHEHRSPADHLAELALPYADVMIGCGRFGEAARVIALAERLYAAGTHNNELRRELRLLRHDLGTLRSPHRK